MSHFSRHGKTKTPGSSGCQAHIAVSPRQKTIELLTPLIIDATKGSLLQNTMHDLQVKETEKLLSYANGFYLETLQEVSANYLT